jgi:hypothetical protein
MFGQGSLKQFISHGLLLDNCPANRTSSSELEVGTDALVTKDMHAEGPRVCMNMFSPHPVYKTRENIHVTGLTKVPKQMQQLKMFPEVWTVD